MSGRQVDKFIEVFEANHRGFDPKTVERREGDKFTDGATNPRRKK